MSSNETNKNLIFPEFKFPISNNSLIEEVPSRTPHKDLLPLKPNNLLLNINTSNISPNKCFFDPKIFINGYNSGNKNSNSEFTQEKMNNNSLIYFNPIKKDKEINLIGKKRAFKYILSSEKKITIKEKEKDINKNINIKKISLHGHHLLNLHLIENNTKFILKNILFPKKLIKLLTKKFHYFNLIHSKNNNEIMKKEFNLEKIYLTKSELVENNLDYFQGEINSEKILRNYCEEMQNTLEKLKNNFITKKKFIYITKNILLLELLIRNCNLYTNFLLKKLPQENKSINNNNNNQDNFPLSRLNLFLTKQSLPLPNKKFFENLPENHTTTTKKENLPSLSVNNINNILINTKQKTNLFQAKIPLINSYKCDFCERVFKNGQALGGHISQSHPNQSSKYKQKIEVRNCRSDKRELLYEARRRLFKAYNIDLDYFIKNKRKTDIKNFIKIHKTEYKKELISLKNKKNNLNINNKDIKENNTSDLSNNIDIEINSSSKEK